MGPSTAKPLFYIKIVRRPPPPPIDKIESSKYQFMFFFSSLFKY